jgi:hypothetical protein
MVKIILITLSFLALLFSPNLVLSDCTDLGRSTSWYVVDDQSIIFYAGNKPLAKIVLDDCTVTRSSNIRLLKTYVCDDDSLLVDGEECSIMTVKLASTGSLE